MISHDLLLRGGDLAFGGIAAASLFGLAPTIAAGLSIAWYLWRFYKEPEFQPRVDAFLARIGIKRGKDEGSSEG